MNLIKLTITTPDKLVYEDTVSEVIIPTKDGQITVLPNHIPLISILAVGEVRIKKEGTVESYAVSGGILEVRPNSEVILLADRSEAAKDINIERAQEAYARAEEAMKQAGTVPDIDLPRFRVNLEKEANRIKIGSKFK
jgi:F-type H+-transporting ATPase subunit epsilon